MVETVSEHHIVIMDNFVIIKVGNKMSCDLQGASSSDSAGRFHTNVKTHQVIIQGRKQGVKSSEISVQDHQQ